MTVRAAVGLALASAVVHSGCSGLLTIDRGGEIRVLVEGDASTPLLVVTSDDFLVGASTPGPEGGVLFVQADTTLGPPPFERTYDLAPTFVFAVRVSIPSGEQGNVRLRVFLDGAGVWDEESLVEADNLIQFYTVRR